MLAQDAALERVALLPRHRAYVQGIRANGLVRRLLKLTPVDQLYVGNAVRAEVAALLSFSPLLKASRTSGQSSSRAVAAARNPGPRATSPSRGVRGGGPASYPGHERSRTP
jgi:hypothetical protein